MILVSKDQFNLAIWFHFMVILVLINEELLLQPVLNHQLHFSRITGECVVKILSFDQS